MTADQGGIIGALMKRCERSRFHPLAKRVLGFDLDRAPTDLEAGKIIGFLRQEAELIEKGPQG